MNAEARTWLVTLCLLVVACLWPRPGLDALCATLTGLVGLLPIVLVAALLAGALALGNTADRAVRLVGRQPGRGIALGSLVGALTPVCGLGVLPLITVLLRRGVPVAAVMAFWVASPITDPAMILITAEVLGPAFALAKTLAALMLGFYAGAVTWFWLGRGGTTTQILRPDPASDAQRCMPRASVTRPAWQAFLHESFDNARLVLRWLALALVLELLLQRHVPHQWIDVLVGSERDGAIPLAAVLGAPFYLDGYAALPLVRGLLDKGMQAPAALALLIAGAAVSLYAAVAVYSVVTLRVFALYVGLAVTGAVLCGYIAALAGL